MNTKPICCMARKLAATLGLMTLSGIPAQSAVEAWVQRYSHAVDSNDSARKVVTDSAGSVIVAGYIDDGIARDFLIIKYSGAGLPLWTNRYDGPENSNDDVSALAVDSSDNVYVTGQSYGSGSDYDYATMAYSGAGVPLWTNRYNGLGNGSDYAYAVAADGSGNVFVTGGSWSGTSGDTVTIAYSDAGVPLWTNRYNGLGNGNDQGNAIAVDGGGSILITGSSWNGSSYDYVTVAYSGVGVALWTNRYNGPENSTDQASALAVDSSGNVFVTGQSYGSGSDYDYATVAYSGAGVPLWTNRYNGPENSADSAIAVAVNGSGHVFVTGSYATVAYSGTGVPLWTNQHNGAASDVAVDHSGNVFVTRSDGDYVTVAYSGAGVAFWTNRYDGPRNLLSDYATAVAIDGSGNVFVTGWSYGDSSSDCATVAYSGTGMPLWTNRYNGLGNLDDYANAMAVDSSGNVFVTGRSDSSSVYDYATVAYSSAGVALWTNRYDGPANRADVATDVAVDRSGNVFVTGRSAGAGWDYATVAYSPIGVPLWTNRYNANGYDYGYAVAVDRSNVFVTGYSQGDYVTVAYSRAGVPLWTNRYDGPVNGSEEVVDIAVEGNGKVFVTGSSESVGGSSDYATVAYSAAGVPLWTNRYSGPGNFGDRVSAMAVDGSGNVFVTGSSYGGSSSYDYATVAYSGAGVPLWTNRYNDLGNDDRAAAIAVDGSGNVFVTGSSGYLDGSHFDYVTVAYSSAGAALWTNRYNGDGNLEDGASAIAVDTIGNVFVTGSSGYSDEVASYFDSATVAYSGSGMPLWTNRYNGPGNRSNSAVDIAVDGGGNVFVTGSSYVASFPVYPSVPSFADYVTIKYWSVRPHLTIESDDHDGYFLHFNAIAGSSYRLERTVSLTNMWETIATQTATTSGRMALQDSLPPPTQAFYRVRVE